MSDVSTVAARLSAFALIAVCALASSSARSASILPLQSEEATLLVGVDSARTSVLTMVATPGSSSRPQGGTVRRLIGTGVVLGPHRLLSTASMAVPGGNFTVLLSGGVKREAHVKGVDRQSNVALFSVDGPPLTPLRQASPQSVAVGSWVAVIANVNVTRPQISLGRVVGRGERVDFPYSGDIVEIEAATYPGASGGAVLNEAGEWVAIVVGRAGARPSSPRGSAMGGEEEEQPEGSVPPTDLLVALPVDQLQRISDDLEQFGSVRRAFLGIQMRRGTAADTLGVLVEGVVPESPAAQAGIRIGDRVLAFEGSVIHSAEEITSLVRTFRPGDEVELTVSRDAEIFPVHATLAAVVGTPPVGSPNPRAAELSRLRQSLRRLEGESQKLEKRIKELEGNPAPQSAPDAHPPSDSDTPR